MRRLLSLAAVLAILVPEATALACMNEMVGSPALGGPVLLGLGFAGVLLHAIFIPLMPTPRIRVLSLLVVGAAVVGADLVLGLSHDAVALVVFILGYAAIAVFHGRGGIQDRAKTDAAVPAESAAESAPPTAAPHPEDRDRAA